MQAGYGLATRGGISFAADDMLVPAEKVAIIAEAEGQVKEIQSQYTSGLVTEGERYNKVVDIWGRAGDDIAKAMMTQLGTMEVKDRDGKDVKQDSFNSIFMMTDSGARGSAAADPAARGHARPDGQARWLHHRDAHHGELPRRPQRAAVLHQRRTARARAWPTPRSRRRTRATSRASLVDVTQDRRGDRATIAAPPTACR
jgi:hypothetical protein